MTKRYSLRALGLSAAIIVGAGGSLAASPAFAAPEILPTAGAEFKKFEDQAFAAGAAGVGTAGKDVLLALDVTADNADELRELGQKHDNVEFLELNGPIKPAAADEVVGGSGYIVGAGGLCSFAFSAWTPEGDEAALTAGHCGQPGAGGDVSRSVPQTDVEFTGGEQDPMDPKKYTAEPLDSFGTFTASQWGGKTDPFAPETDPTVTDIAVVEKTNPDLKMKPEVTDWTTKASGDLAKSTQTITSVGKATKGQTIKKSGRTTGLTQGTVEGDMVFGVTDIEDPTKLHYVTGFVATNTLRPGDSGGAWFNDKGEALGISSAYVLGSKDCAEDDPNCSEHDFSFVTDINHGLEQMPAGTEVRLHVDAPTVADATVAPGATVSGTTESNATAEAAEGSEDPAGFKAAAGTFSFTAPTEPGEYTYSFIARKGKFNVSEKTTVTVTVEASAPTPTDDPTTEPTDDPTATEDPSDDPTATEDPSDDPVKRALAIDPENIKATDFVKKDAVEILATGCTPGTEANLEVKPRGSNVTGHTDTATVDEDGNVGFTVYGENADMPNAYIGEYDVTVSCDGGDDLTGTFTVTEAGGKDDDGKGGDDKKDDKKELPRTGSEALGSLGAAAALIAGGAGLYVLARRRKN
ncbi:S1 family peptidase [Brevibacterium gallinarum]|uniref:Trypsin-like serine protease n=1 Tax=Brevibacterium gallinarum TaxID=2762220 RepID=A0ABR8WXN2_9MICO|nr:S1 family peptidase [Brevibacterium gallinarum]MBD8021848.1 trypsin-like serine protease [Brevibacterium gallinarum]